MPTAVDVPLADHELDALEQRGLDVDHVIGMIHAVAVAPGMIPVSQWLPLAFANVAPDQATVGLVLRLYNQVLDGLAKGRGNMIPAPEDETACVAFAAGYVAAAVLDPAWRDDTARWTFAAPLAFLGERHDLVPDGFFANVPTQEAREIILRDLDKLVYEAYRSFAKVRRTLAQARESRAITARVGRNEPCPCGSGKKYKRCCIARSA